MSLRDAADPPTDAAFAERVQADLVRGQYHLTTPVEFAGAGYSLVLGWALWNHVPHAALGGWVLLRLLVTAIRIGHGLSFVRDPRSAERTRLWQRRFLLMAITEGLSWGLLPVLALPTGDSALDGVVLASLVGVASIGLFVTQGIASTGIAFSLCALLPQLAVHLQMGTRSGWAAVGGLVIDDGRHAVVGCDRQEFGRELLSTTDVHRDDPVGQAGFLEKQRDLVTIRRWPVVEIDHPCTRCLWFAD